MNKELKKVFQSLGTLGFIFSQRRYVWIGIGLTIAYFLVYLWSTDLINFGTNQYFDSTTMLPDWQDKVWKLRTPFNWEPVGIVIMGPIQLSVALPNYILAALMSMLFGAVFSVYLFSRSAPKTCRMSPLQSFLGSFLPFLSGFACCAPAFLVALGIFSATLTVSFSALLPYFVPTTFLILIISLWWNCYNLFDYLEDMKQEKK